jgi:hypothetical protein
MIMHSIDNVRALLGYKVDLIIALQIRTKSPKPRGMEKTAFKADDLSDLYIRINPSPPRISRQVDPSQVPVIDQLHHIHRHQELHTKPLLLKPPGDQPSLHVQAPAHHINPIIIRILGTRLCIQICRRQRSLRIRCPRRTHVRSILTAEAIEIGADREREV